MKRRHDYNLCLIHSLRIIHIADARCADAASPAEKLSIKAGTIRCEARIVDCMWGSAARRSILE